jgi:hypothetical protein
VSNHVLHRRDDPPRLTPRPGTDGIGGSWVHETDNVKQIAIGDSYLGALLSDGSLYVKDGLGGTWVHETDNVQQVAIDGTKIGVLLTNAAFDAKDGIDGSWVHDTDNVKQIAIGG